MGRIVESIRIHAGNDFVAIGRVYKTLAKDETERGRLVEEFIEFGTVDLRVVQCLDCVETLLAGALPYYICCGNWASADRLLRRFVTLKWVIIDI